MLSHRVIEKDKSKVIVLFHGTGGDASDLLQLGEQVDPTATLIGLRGNVVEGSMNRFFKRKAPGVFDIENLKEETKHVFDTLKHLSNDYQFQLKDVLLLGYSNGANMVGSLLLHYGDFVNKAILMHPMVPIRDFEVHEMRNLKVLLTAGTNDQICDKEEAIVLKDMLTKAGANVQLNWYDFGHQISKQEVLDLIAWTQDKD